MRKLALFAFSFSAAVFLFEYLHGIAWLWPALGIAAASAMLARRRGWGAGVLLLTAAGLCAGFAWSAGYGAAFQQPARLLDGQTMGISAVAEDYSQSTEYGAKVTVRLLREGERSIRTVFYGDEDALGLRPGDRISCTARLADASRVRGEEVDTFTARGVFLLSYQEGALEIDRARSVPFRCWPAVAAHRLNEVIGKVFRPDVTPFMKALVMGNRTEFADAFTSALAVSGLTHTVAVSGMHISFLVGVFLLLVRRRRRAALLAIPLIIGFSAILGGSPSVVRAAVMQSIILLADALGRENDPPTALGFSLMVILLANPFAAADAGLQLSFASIAGILLFSESLNRVFLGFREGTKPAKKPGPLRKATAAVLASTLAAMAFTAPLTAVYFDSVSLIAPLANLLALWAVSLAFAAGLGATVLGLVWLPLGKLAALAVWPVAKYLTVLIPGLAAVPFAAVYTQNVYIKMWLVYAYLLLALLLFRPTRRRAALSAALAAAGLCAALLLPSFRIAETGLTVSVLNVGQGESVLFTSGGGAVLVDCGGNGAENAGDVAAKQIQSTGRNRLDLLILTHYDVDHTDGLEALFARVRVARLMAPDTEDDTGNREKVLALAGKYGTEIYFVEKDTVISFGEAVGTVYAPLGGAGDNEEGLCFLCSAGSFDVLLTGDMDASGEKKLLRHAALPDLELLVAGHHGSKYSTSEELLEATTPEISVVSSGQNSYGHPAPETLERLEERGIKIYRTDRMGTVTVRAG